MRLYWALARQSFRRTTTYRGATFAGAFTNTVFGFLIAYVLLAVYAERPEINGYDASEAVTFTFVMQGLLMVVGMFGDTDIADRIKSGDVIVDLYRPVDFQGWWFAEHCGKAAFYAVFRGLPPFLAGALVFDLVIPTSPLVWLSFLATMVLAIPVAFGWRFLLQISAFWILDVRGPNQIGWLTAGFFGGFMVPLFLFPDWLGTVAAALPFASMLALPVETYLGKHTGADLLGVLAVQAVWAVVLLGTGRLLLHRALRRVVVQGG